jgi:hypothetical protein
MANHLASLLRSAWLLLLGSLSSSPLNFWVFSIILPIAIFLAIVGGMWWYREPHTAKGLGTAFQHSLFPGIIAAGLTVVTWAALFSWALYRSVYNDHQNLAGHLRAVINEKDFLKRGLKERDDYIDRLKNAKPVCPVCSSGVTVLQAPSAPRALSDLQRTVLMRDLKEGIGLNVRINSIGKMSDTHTFANELQDAFKGWNIQRNTIGATSTTSPSELEFVIPQPQDRAVQIAIRAFDHAHIQYSKNVDPYSSRGPGEPPALTINVRDR